MELHIVQAARIHSECIDTGRGWLRRLEKGASQWTESISDEFGIGIWVVQVYRNWVQVYDHVSIWDKTSEGSLSDPKEFW